mgnify:CR=1 FL=1
MLNKLWPAFLIISIIFAILNGRIGDLNNSIFESANSAVQLTITLFGTLCFWNGIMQIAIKSSLVDTICKILNPLIKFLFPEIKKGEKTHKEISMNIIANMLGLGNAATPLGLKAMKSMQEENQNKDRLSNSMVMFIIVNTASIQIIPTTVIAIRNSLNSGDPSKIILPVWIVTICAAASAVLVGKIITKFGK